MEQISKEHIRQYLWETHHTTPEDLFNPKAKYAPRTHEILNDVFKEHTGHWIDFSGILITQNPQNNLEIIHYKNYTNFHHINSLDDLMKDMRKARELNHQEISTLESRLQQLKHLKKNTSKDLDV